MTSSSLRTSARVFLLSPASLAGIRGGRILREESGAPFMEALRGGGAVPLGQVYAFISSLYYRGKRSYARSFARRPSGGSAVFAITPNRGLIPDATPVTLEELRALAAIDIDPENPAYLGPLLDTARGLEEELDRETREGPPSGESAAARGVEVVLLGSIASGKYLDPLGAVFRDRLLVPSAFVGRGDMSRGGLLLRAVESGEELAYVQALGTDRRGLRPPRLSPAHRSGPP